MHVTYLTIDGLRVRVYQAGATGPWVLFLHGAGAAADTWVRNLDPIADQGFRVLAPDLLGHGLTDGDSDTSLPSHLRQTRHLRRVLESFGVESTTIVGSAWGALLGGLLYFDRPRLVNRLAFIASASALSDPHQMGKVIAASRANQTRALQNPTLESIRKRNVNSNWNKEDVFEEILLIQLSALSLPDRTSEYERALRDMEAARFDPNAQVFHRLEEIDVPVLIIAGHNDPRASHADLAAAATRLRRASIEIFPQCGHKPFAEKAREFNATLLAFLRSGQSTADLPART